MKKLAFIFALMLLAITCDKKEESADVDYDVSGEVVDVVTGKGIPNIGVYVEMLVAQCLNCPLYYVVKDSSVTDDNGQFELKYQSSGTEWIKISTIPSRYQQGARVNGALYYCIALHDFILEVVGYTINQDGEFCRIEFMPDAYVRIIKPVVPAEWEQDTLELTTKNICVFDHCDGRSCYEGISSTEAFSLNDTLTWNKIKKPHFIDLGNTVHFSYKIRNGLVIKKSGDFSVDCALGDTTDIVLPLF